MKLRTFITLGTLALPLSSVLAEENNTHPHTEIFVTADPLEPSLFESGHPASVLSRDQIIERNQSSLGDTIDLEPGVRSNSFGPGASRPTIRGFAGDRVRIMRNGLGSGDVSSVSEDHAISADPLELETIEILRGPETLLYGSNAIGGSVNVIDGSIPEKPLGKPIQVDGLLQKGDAADEELSSALRIRGEQESFQWNISGFVRDTENIEIPGFAEADHDEEEEHSDEARGTLPNSDVESRGATVGGSHIWSDGFFGIAASVFSSEYGIPGAHEGHEEEDHDEDSDEHDEAHSKESGPRIDLEQFRVDLRGRVDAPASNIEAIKFKAGYTTYEHDEIEDSGEIGSTFENDSFELRADVVHSLFSKNRGVFGTQWSYEEFSAVGEESFVQPTDSFSPAIFTYQELSLLEDLTLHFGGRFEFVSRSPDIGSTEEFTPFGFSIGSEWDPTGTFDYLLALHVAYTQRAPSTSELFADGPHLARGIFEVGNTNLSKESSWGVDLTFKKNYGVFTGSVTPFWQVFSNYINLQGTGEEEDSLPVFSYEDIDASFFGFEVQTSLHLDQLFRLEASQLALDVQVDYVEGENDDQYSDLPRIPPLRTLTRLRYSDDSLRGAIEGVFVEEQDNIAPFESRTGGYALLNANLEFKAPFVEEHELWFFIRGTNLTDEEARVHSSFLKDEAPLRGRAFLFGIRGTL